MSLAYATRETVPAPRLERTPARPVPDAHSALAPAPAVLGLQRTHGNRYVQETLAAHPPRSESTTVRRQQWSSGARVGTGVLIGAGIGALIGSVIPGVGTAIGAGVGALIVGLIGGLIGYFSGLRVSIPRIRAATTPREMVPDRIPPRLDFDVPISIAGYKAGEPPIRVEVDGSGGPAGTVAVDGHDHQMLVASRTVRLNSGSTQTAPGGGERLRLVAKQGNRLVAESDPFCVSAIPLNNVATLQGEVRYYLLAGGHVRGIVVDDTWQSDSGDVGDLGEVRLRERVEIEEQTGCFVGMPMQFADYLPAVRGAGVDRHLVPTVWLTGPGRLSTRQTVQFRDNRAHVSDIPMARTGYRITRDCVRGRVSEMLRITTAKVGAAVEARGIASAAGATNGQVSATQDV